MLEDYVREMPTAMGLLTHRWGLHATEMGLRAKERGWQASMGEMSAAERYIITIGS